MRPIESRDQEQCGYLILSLPRQSGEEQKTPWRKQHLKWLSFMKIRAGSIPGVGNRESKGSREKCWSLCRQQ